MPPNRERTPSVTKNGKRVGRPPKEKRPVGRPKGDTTIMNEYKMRMLNSPNSKKVLQKVFEVALDDDHKHQAACLKLVLDRIAPVGAFDMDFKDKHQGSKISINITGIGESQGITIEGHEDAEEVEYVDVQED